MRHKLVIFDCDGTLVDSQQAILAAMNGAFRRLSWPPPSPSQVLGVVGLSLREAFAALAPAAPAAVQARLVELYRCEFAAAQNGALVTDPVFAGIAEVIATLSAREDIILGIATGKSRRGVSRLIAREGWQSAFFTVQTADEHPSKPHPSMILRAMAEAGVEREATVMVGDTCWDMEMAVNAQVAALGVAWGYHAPELLTRAGAHALAPTCQTLPDMIDAELASRKASA
jgi:phosphoglycolate phosphatase